MVQKRAVETRQKIVAGLVRVIVQAGLPGVTHRAVAQAAGVSLAATTRHFDTKDAMLTEVSGQVLAGYLAGLDRLRGRIERGQAPGIARLDDVVALVTRNALVRERDLSLAWCELILHGGRSAQGRALARRWFDGIDGHWRAIAATLGDGSDEMDVTIAVDTAVGLLFLLHPFRLQADQVGPLLAGQTTVAADPGNVVPQDAAGATGRAHVLAAAIGVLVDQGPQAVSYRAVAERAGLSRSAPGYYFATVDAMLEAAQTALFARAKDRYRDGFRAHERGRLDAGQLADLTSAIFGREALQYPQENLAFHSVWVRAAVQDSLRPAIGAALHDQQQAWRQALSSVGAPPANALRVQALFVGKLVRAMTAGADLSQTAGAREQFLRAMQKRYSCANDGAVIGLRP